MNLKKIIIIRGGVFNEKNMHLDGLGIRQMIYLLYHLKKNIPSEEKVLLISSSAPWALDSVKILSEGLSILYETTPLFWSDINHKQNDLRALNYIKQRVNDESAEIVIIVTHLEYVRSLPQKIAKEFGKLIPYDHKPIKKGDMLLLDFVKEKSFVY